MLAAYALARRLPYVDASRIILAGQSAGGVAALYAAAQAPEGGVPCAGERLAVVFEEVGRTLEAPALLYYAQNDQFFGPEVSRGWFARLKAGAQAEYVLQPPFGTDGHYVFTDAAGAALWLPAVERFLARHGIPFRRPAQLSAPSTGAA